MPASKPLEIIVTAEERDKFKNLYISVRRFTDAGIDVPFGFVKALLDLMYDSDTLTKKQFWKEAEKCSVIAIKRISELKGFQFNWKDSIWLEKYVIKQDTSSVLTEIIYAFFLYKHDHDKMDKDDVISFFYQAFDDDYKSRLKPDVQMAFKPFKQAIISGILTMSVGYKLSSKSDLTIDEIFQSTRNSIKKYKKD